MENGELKMKHLLQIALFFLVSSVVSAQSFYFERRFDIPVNDTAGNPIKEPWFGGLNAVIIGEIDLNFDGYLDLVVYDQHAERIFTFLNKGLGPNGINNYVYASQFAHYFPRIAPTTPDRMIWFQLVDFDGDELPDLLMSNGYGGIRAYRNVSQNPNIRFELYTEWLMEQLPGGGQRQIRIDALSVPHFVDIDSDGDVDMLIFRGTGLNLYQNRRAEHGGTSPFDLAFADDMWGCFGKSAFANEIILNTCPDASSVSKMRSRHCEGGTTEAIQASAGSATVDCFASLAMTGKARDNNNDNYIPVVPLHGEGSAIFAFDFNSTGVFDLLLTDGGYPFVTALFNAGTPNDARISHYDSAFPRLGKTVHLLSTPVVSAVDINSSGQKSLVFSPFDARRFSIESYASIWVYRNMNLNGDADFQLISQRFLQDEMLDFGMGAFPTFVDIDGNGLLDIVVGNHGRTDSIWHDPTHPTNAWQSRLVADLTLLRNIGTLTNPEFRMYPLQLSPPLDITGAVPTFGDVDNDGYLDLFIGTACGKILHYRNRYAIAEEHFPPYFELVNANILEDIVWNGNNVGVFLAPEMGTFLAPQLFDVNGDGLLDLVVGNQYTLWFNDEGQPFVRSSITYFQNTGTRESPEFTLVADYLGEVDVIRERIIFGVPFRDPTGHSAPHFFRTTNGNTHLFSGNEAGQVLHFSDIDGNLNGRFQRMNDIHFLLNNRVQTLCESLLTAVAVADLNNDGYLDLVVGNHRGGLTIFFGISEFPPTNIVDRDVETHGRASLRVFPNPVQDFLIVEIDKPYQMRGEILDLHGRVVQNLPTIKNGENIDVSSLSAGVYILRIVVNNQIFTQKFIKM